MWEQEGGGGGKGIEENEENNDMDDAKEKDAAWSFVSCSLEKEMDELRPSLLLSYL